MIKILIMDDEPGLRNVVYNMLKPLGHPIFVTEDGSQAIETAKKEIPDIAMLDMRVPDMDGLEVLEELKKINPNIKAIMLSGFGDVETAVVSLKKGAFDYISKPFKVNEVLEVVNKAISTISGVSQKTGGKPATTAPVKEMKPSSFTLGKMHYIIAGAVITAAVILSFIVLGGSKAKEFAVPYSNPTGMVWIKGDFWISDWISGNVYKHKNDGKLSVDTVYKSRNENPMGLAFDGEYIWSCNMMEHMIYKHNIDDTMSPYAIYALGSLAPSALYFDGANMWVMYSDTAKIYKHKMDEGFSIVSAYDSPALNPSGMFRMDEHFYISDYRSGKIYKVSVVDFSLKEVYEVDEIKNNEYKISGISYSDGFIWIAPEGIGKIIKINVNDLEPVKL